MDDDRIGDATYDPEDDKLRLYPYARLSADDYARAKGAGFRWAPRQELFFAIWSPAAEDLLTEWCGEIGEEGTTLAERAEDRAELVQHMLEAEILADHGGKLWLGPREIGRASCRERV